MILSWQYLSPIAGGVKRLVLQRGRSYITHGLTSPRYTYAMWLRVLVKLREHGLDTNPGTIVELGPGHSLGIAAAAMLTGTDRYVGLDIRPYARPDVDVATLSHLEQHFTDRARIPGRDEFPRLHPQLDDCRFPADILTPERLQRSLAPERRARIRDAIERRGTEGPIKVQYRVPWEEADLPRGEADLVITQAVMQCIPVSMIRDVYRQLFAALRPGGVAMHQIDFAFPLGTPFWNYHRAYSDLAWFFVDYDREYAVTRLMLSDHLTLARDAGFREVEITGIPGQHGLTRAQVASRFRQISDQDFDTAAAFVVLQRPPGAA